MNYCYNWEAIFEDNSIIKQFNNETENSFKEVILKKEQLVEFRLISTDGLNRIFSVNLKTGEFNLNGTKIESSLVLSEYKNVSPIFWRRNKIILLGEKNTPTQVGFIIGWQVNVEGKNYQHQFMIKPDGGIILLHKV